MDDLTRRGPAGEEDEKSLGFGPVVDPHGDPLYVWFRLDRKAMEEQHNEYLKAMAEHPIELTGKFIWDGNMDRPIRKLTDDAPVADTTKDSECQKK